MANNLDLNTIFQSITERLSEQKESLNEADTYNHNHGDNMVQIFNLVQNAVAQKSNKPVAEQLDYASKLVEKEANSGSAKLYVEGLSNASKNLSGAELNQDTLGVLVKSLFNVEEPKTANSSDGILGSLLSGLTGKSEGKKSQSLGVDELLRAGMAFYQSKQDGDSNMDAIMGALMAASPMGQTAHRSQSGSLVASTIMNLAKSFNN